MAQQKQKLPLLTKVKKYATIILLNDKVLSNRLFPAMLNRDVEHSCPLLHFRANPYPSLHRDKKC